MPRNRLQLREGALRKHDIVVAKLAVMSGLLCLALSGCSTACFPGNSNGMRPPGGCLDTWECPGIGPNAGLFQVVCTGKDASGWTGCQCVHDGTVVRTLESPQTVWCRSTTPDSFERLIDANRECGWALDTSAI